MKIEVTPKAKEELKRVLESRKDSKPLRIYIASYGWGGPSFGLALDELKENDISLDADGFKFIIEDYLAENFNSFTIDYSNSWLRKGFSVIPDRIVSSC